MRLFNITIRAGQGVLDATIPGTIGPDTLRGGVDDDSINGGDGGDMLSGGGGDDTLNGGDGRDTVAFRGAPAGVTVMVGFGAPQDTGHGVDLLIGIENAQGTRFDDDISGDFSNNFFWGGGGDDTITGFGGSDRLKGGGGDDTYLYVSDGDSAPGERDVIRDLENNDVIDLHIIDADVTSGGGDDAFTRVANLTGDAGELVVKYRVSTDRTIIRADVNGDGQADLAIWVVGDHRDFTNFVF